MNILHLMPETPTKVGGGGHVRNHHFAVALSSRYDLTLAILTEQSDPEDDLGPLIKHAKLLQPAKNFNQEKRYRRRRMWSLNRALSTLVSPIKDHGKYLVIAGNGNCVHRARRKNLKGLNKFYASLLWHETNLLWRAFKFYPSSTLVRLEEFQALIPKILEMHDRKPFDLIWCEHSYLYPLVEQLVFIMPNISTVCDAHNNEWLFLRRMAEKEDAPSARRWLHTESNIAAYWEKRMLDKADLVFCCSDIDREHLATLVPASREKIKVISNGVDTEYFQSNGKFESKSGGILFTGSAGYRPNDDAVNRLVKEIMPIVRQSLPECPLYLAGHNAAEHWGHYEQDHQWVTVVSDVPDMRPCFNKATVFVVPLRSGSGTRLKILEAMSMGKAVVSTNVGAEGLDVVSGIHLVLEDSSDSIAKGAISLVKNCEIRHAMGEKARRLVVEKYQWNALTLQAIEQLQNAFH